jgi:hypothetical protein
MLNRDSKRTSDKDKCTSLLKYYQGNNEDEKKYNNKKDFEKTIGLILSKNKIPFKYIIF